MYCRAGGRGFDSRGRTYTITGRYFICSAKGSIFAWLWSPRTVKQAFPSPAADTNTVTSISTSCWIPSQPLGQWEGRKKEKPRDKVWDIRQNERYVKKVFKRKLISVLFEILKGKDDYLGATMITREIKSRNPKPWLLSQVVLNRFVFLAFEFITHISSLLFLCFLLIICNIWFVIELICHASTSVFLLTACQKIVLAVLW